jgi:antitoxin (DNA-binding transcriptional repressor) of toxin-antitoxin stability system
MQRVLHGEQPVVTLRGRPVARIVPFVAQDAVDVLLCSGAVVPASASGVDWISLNVDWDVDAALDAERDDMSW